MAEPIRIAFVITELEFGGAERCLANLVTGIDRARFVPIVCALKSRPAAGEDLLVQQLESANVPVHFLNLRSPASFLTGVMKLKRLLRQHETDVVQTFLFHANVIGALAAQAAGVARVFGGIRVADPSRWRMTLERFAMRRVDQVVCVSRSVAEQVASKGRFPRPKLRVIPNGIDLAKVPAGTSVNRSQLDIPPDRKILLCVGRLHEQKGFDWLLQLTPELFRRLPEHHLVIVGDGPERKPLSELADRLAIQDKVHFIGWRPYVLQWIQEGVQEILGPLAERQAVRFGDGSAFLDVVCEIIDSTTLHAKLGEANRARIQAEFSLRAMISKYEALYGM
ncbi:MAG: glycosyltransferase [Planctomycetia bacterium]|nr:glycosyltransferase [Planctomycetia bacterium]